LLWIFLFKSRGGFMELNASLGLKGKGILLAQVDNSH